MSESAMFLRHRPQTWGQVVGQDDAVATLASQVETGRVRQAYLISGPHGVGKTTLARLLAAAVGCTGMDLHEADAGSNRGIDDVRAWTEASWMMPMQGSHRVFILDEAHQLTDAAANALLKVLEEPPASAIFILCTTEPQKIKATVRSRCQQIKLKRPSTEQIVSLLFRIAEAEGIKHEPGAFGAIADATGGSFRDAVSLLDQLSTSGSVTTGAVLAFSPAGSGYYDLVDQVSSGAIAAALGTCEEAFASGADPAVWLAGLLDHLRQLLVVRVGGKVWGPEAPKIQAQSKKVNPEIVRRFAEALIPATDVVRRVDMRLLMVLAIIDMAEAFHKEST